MKKIILAIALMFVSVSLVQAAETKKVCEKTKDAKGKEKEVCKNIKIHKKLDGEKLPEKK
jgi:hypothetical protein